MFAKVMPRLGSPPKDRSAAPFLFVSGLMRCPKATESCRPIKSLIPVFFSTHHPRIETIEARPLPALVHRSPRILWHGLSPSFLLVSTSHLQQTGNSEDTTPSFSFWLVSQGAVPLIHLFASLPESINGPRYVGESTCLGLPWYKGRLPVFRVFPIGAYGVPRSLRIIFFYRREGSHPIDAR